MSEYAMRVSNPENYALERILSNGLFLGEKRERLDRIIDPEPLLGEEKFVYKNSRDGSKFTHSRRFRATNEAIAYKTLSRTPLGVYIPQFIGLLYDKQNSVLGLATKWEDRKSVV